MEFEFKTETGTEIIYPKLTHEHIKTFTRQRYRDGKKLVELPLAGIANSVVIRLKLKSR